MTDDDHTVRYLEKLLREVRVLIPVLSALQLTILELLKTLGRK